MLFVGAAMVSPVKVVRQKTTEPCALSASTHSTRQTDESSYAWNGVCRKGGKHLRKQVCYDGLARQGSPSKDDRTLCPFRKYSLHEANRRKSVCLVERVMGIGPTRPAWKAGILPLNYTRTLSFSQDAYKLYQNVLSMSTV